MSQKLTESEIILDSPAVSFATGRHRRKCIRNCKIDGWEIGKNLSAAAEFRGIEFFVRFNNSCILMFLVHYYH